MNMTKDGIGWGVTQNITNYNGATINVPVGCVVSVRSPWRTTSALNAKFSGTFAMLSLQYNNVENTPTIVGSSIPLFPVGRSYDSSTEEDYIMWGGNIHQALLKEEKEAA